MKVIFSLLVLALIALSVNAATASGGELCGLCELGVSAAEEWLASNKTEAEIDTLFDEVCSVFPAATAKECQAYVKMYVPMIIGLLQNNAKPETVCSTLGLCSSAAAPAPAKEQGESTLCEVCLLVASWADYYLKQNYTVSDIEKELDAICNDTPFASQCTGYVDAYLPMIIDYLADMSPNEVCQKLGVCSSSSAREAMRRLPRAALPQDTMPCDLCLLVVSWADYYLKQNYTISDIEKELDAICNDTPFASQCTQYVDAYLPMIIDYLASYKPNEVCQKLGACSQAAAAARNAAAQQAAKAAVERDTVPCDLCLLVVSWADYYLKQNYTVEDIEKELDAICNDTPFASQCTGYVDAYLPMIIDYLASYKPNEVCQKIGVCPASKATQEAFRAHVARLPEAAHVMI